MMTNAFMKWIYVIILVSTRLDLMDVNAEMATVLVMIKQHATVWSFIFWSIETCFKQNKRRFVFHHVDVYITSYVV